jgi:hypothetical protein
LAPRRNHRQVKDDTGDEKDSPGARIFSTPRNVFLVKVNNLRRSTMDHTLIRYGVKPAGVSENRTLVTKVFEALDETQPQSVRYLVLELENGEFIHVVSQDKDSSAITGLAAFKAFSAGHSERRSAPVVRSPAKIIGNYRMLAAAE